MAACFTLPHGPPTVDHVSRWLELASDALYKRSDDDLEELVIQLEQARLDLVRQEVRDSVPPVPPEPENDDDLIDEDPDDEDEEPQPFQSHRRITLDPPILYHRLASIRTTGKW
jgi:hypothetical protein